MPDISSHEYRHFTMESAKNVYLPVRYMPELQNGRCGNMMESGNNPIKKVTSGDR